MRHLQERAAVALKCYIKRTLRSYGTGSKQTELTSTRYPGLKRGQYSEVTDEDVRAFETFIPSRVVTNLDEISPHNVDWLKMVR